MLARALANATIVVFASGCGAKSLDRERAPGAGGDTGAASAAAGASAAARVPTKNGVPVSDCTDPTAEELSAAGCPLAEPVPGTECDVPAGTRCYYAIETDPAGMWSQQTFTYCDGGSWTMLYFKSCGVTCEASGPPLSLDTSDCLARPLSPCQTTDGPDDTPISAQSGADRLLGELINGCAGGFGRGIKLEVEYVDGCPATLSTALTVAPELVDCLASALAELRWECAVPTLCSKVDRTLR